jgi:hypothetical protein
MKKLLLVLFLTLFPVLAHGAIYYVAKTGSDSNSCSSAQSQSTPKLTVNAGISCLNGGDTLIIKAGTYVEQILGDVPSGISAAQPTTIRSEVTHGAIIQPGAVFDIMHIGFGSTTSNVVIDGLLLDGNNITRGYGFRFGANASNITFQNNEIKNIMGNNSANNSGGIGFSGTNAGYVVRGNVIHDLGMSDSNSLCSSCYTYGMYLATGNVLIENNEFYNTSGYAIHGYDGGGGGVSNNIIRNNYFRDTGTLLIACAGTGNQVHNNVLARVGTTAAPYDRQGIRVCSNNNVLYNNTIVASGRDCIALGSGNTARNNICWQNGNDAITGQGNTLSNNLLGQNPLFINAAAADFHLQNGSPAIDAGAVMPGLSFNGSAPDLGAFEAGAGGQLPAPTKLRLVGN